MYDLLILAKFCWKMLLGKWFFTFAETEMTLTEDRLFDHHFEIVQMFKTFLLECGCNYRCMYKLCRDKIPVHGTPLCTNGRSKYIMQFSVNVFISISFRVCNLLNQSIHLILMENTTSNGHYIYVGCGQMVICYFNGCFNLFCKISDYQKICYVQFWMYLERLDCLKYLKVNQVWEESETN